MSDLKPLLRDLESHELPVVLTDLGEPGYRGHQLAKWLFEHGALTWEQMTNLPVTLQHRLAQTYDLQALQLAERFVASDSTRKYLFTLRDTETIESVLIPMENHATFCVSTQVGCLMACRFCATTHGGLVRQLTSGEILEQVVRLKADLAEHPLLDHGQRQFNIVFMGMGEPLDNWPAVSKALDVLTAKNGFAISARRITLSTSGHRSGLASLLANPDLKVGLTLSLCGVSEKRRRRLMPVAGRHSLTELLGQAAEYARRIKRRITLAYILIEDESDQLEEASALAALVRDRPFKVNLIPFNTLDDQTWQAPTHERVLAFQNSLRQSGVEAYIRQSGGQDIAAACGQLRNRKRIQSARRSGDVG